MVIFHGKLLNNQMVTIDKPVFFPLQGLPAVGHTALLTSKAVGKTPNEASKRGPIKT